LDAEGPDADRRIDDLCPDALLVEILEA